MRNHRSHVPFASEDKRAVFGFAHSTAVQTGMASQAAFKPTVYIIAQFLGGVRVFSALDSESGERITPCLFGAAMTCRGPLDISHEHLEYWKLKVAQNGNTVMNTFPGALLSIVLRDVVPTIFTSGVVGL